MVNFIVAFVVDKVTKEPPEHIQHLVEGVRVPARRQGRGRGARLIAPAA